MVSEYILGIALMIMSVVLMVLVLMQTGNDKGLSGSISGGSSDTYYGKGKAKSREKLLSRLTLIASVVFAILIIVTFIVFARYELKGYFALA